MGKKRFFDILFSLLGIVLFSPLFFLIALLAKIKRYRPLIKIETVYGKDFQLFRCSSFNVASDNPQKKSDIQANPFPLANLLRSLHGVKLPQLIHVLKGEMSLVGPCPEPVQEVDRYRNDFEIILQVCPGMVDLASPLLEEPAPRFSAPRASVSDQMHLMRRIKLAKEYVCHHTLGLDFKILTAAAVKIMLSWPFPFYKLRERRGTLQDVLTNYRGAVIFGLHVLAAFFSNYFGFLLRYDGAIPEPVFRLFTHTVPLLILLRLTAIHLLGLHLKLWRYVGTLDLAQIALATIISSGGLWVAIKLIPLAGYSRSVLVVDAVLFTICVAALRCTKTVYKRVVRITPGARKVLIIGAGNAGAMMAQDLQQNPSYGRTPIAFIDDDPYKQKVKIHGIPVIGTCDMLDTAVKQVFAEEIVVALPSAATSRVKAIFNRCRLLGLPIKWIPPLPALLNGHVSILDLRPLDIEDLIGRPEIKISKHDVEVKVKGKSVLVTGAGGSIGSELCRHIATFEPKGLVLYEQNENNLHAIFLDLRSRFPTVSVVGVLGDILNARKVEQTFSRYAPQMVFHAAAYKHVPMMEDNPSEAVENNIMGTEQILRAAVQYHAEEFVLISTDKAVHPTSIMGATKRIAEMIVQYHAPRVATRLLTVRFGNVLESNGSVVPLFREQIKRGEAITITDPEVKRYFITIDEAVQLVLQAAVMGKGGEVFVLDMGEPHKIVDLAKTMITLAGFTPYLDVPIRFIGLRPGEKLVEELFESHEEIKSTAHPKINIAQNGKVAYDIPASISKLEAALKQDVPPDAMRRLLKELLPSSASL